MPFVFTEMRINVEARSKRRLIANILATIFFELILLGTFNILCVEVKI